MKIFETKLQFSFSFHPEFPTMTQRHKFVVRDQGGRGERLKMVEGHLKTKENVAGLGSKLNSKRNKKISAVPEDCLPFGGDENIDRDNKSPR